MNLLIKLCVLFFVPFCLSAKNINVYLRFDDPLLHSSVTKFNSFLESNSIFSRYQVEPFLKNHPLHITLYLASYPEGHLDELKKQVRHIAKLWNPIKLNATSIFITTGNFVMLDVDMSKQPNGENHPLQQLSDEVIMKLSHLRDFNAPIPIWAESIPEKKKAFNFYGSPNVFFEFSPHFSLLAKNFSTLEEQINFQKEMKQLVQEYNFKAISTEAAVIGIGYSDDFGQVIEEIEQYHLNG